MSIQECPICSIPPTDQTPLLPIRFHDPRHQFHEICLYNWFQHQGSCPLCRERVRILNDPREEPPADSAAAIAQGIFVQQHPLIAALRENRPIDDLLAVEEITQWTKENAIRMAALHGRQPALENLIQTDSDRGIAIPFLIPDHTNLIAPLIGEAENQNQVLALAIIEAARVGHQEALNHLIETEDHRALAIAFAAPTHLQLVEALINNANDQNEVRRQAIVKATSNNRREALDTLIQTEGHRALAVAFAAPDYMDLVQSLLNGANDPIDVRYQAIAISTLNNRREALNALIQTEDHRALGVAFAAPDYMDLVQILISNANDPIDVRLQAIVKAASNNREGALNALIQTEDDRALAIACAAPNHMDLVQSLLNNANDQNSTRYQAIVKAALNNRRTALAALIQTEDDRTLAIASAAPNHMELVQYLLNNANNEYKVRCKAIATASLNNKGAAIEALIQTEGHRALAIAFAAPSHMELVQALINNGNNQNKIRYKAICEAAYNNRGAALDVLIQTEDHRALAIAFAAPDYMDLVQILISNANDQNEIRIQAIAKATRHNRQAALEALNQLGRN